jgi:hypothetical protein
LLFLTFINDLPLTNEFFGNPAANFAHSITYLDLLLYNDNFANDADWNSLVDYINDSKTMQIEYLNLTTVDKLLQTLKDAQPEKYWLKDKNPKVGPSIRGTIEQGISEISKVECSDSSLLNRSIPNLEPDPEPEAEPEAKAESEPEIEEVIVTRLGTKRARLELGTHDMEAAVAEKLVIFLKGELDKGLCENLKKMGEEKEDVLKRLETLEKAIDELKKEVGQKMDKVKTLSFEVALTPGV